MVSDGRGSVRIYFLHATKATRINRYLHMRANGVNKAGTADADNNPLAPALGIKKALNT